MTVFSKRAWLYDASLQLPCLVWSSAYLSWWWCFQFVRK